MVMLLNCSDHFLSHGCYTVALTISLYSDAAFTIYLDIDVTLLL